MLRLTALRPFEITATVFNSGPSSGKSMRLNRFLVALIVFALCIPAQAQQPAKVPRIGILIPTSTSFYSARVEAFRQRLRELGYVKEKDIVIEYRYAEGKLEQLPDLAAELV